MRALPLEQVLFPSGLSYFSVPTDITNSDGTLTYDMLLRGLDSLIAYRDDPTRW